MGSMTTTLQQIADQCKLHTKLQNYFNVGGVTGQPFLQIATNVNQLLLQRRMPWKFNKGELGWENFNFFVTQQGFQDVLFAGASCFTLLNSAVRSSMPFGGVGINLATANGLVLDPITGIITIKTLDPHPFQSSNIGVTLYIAGATVPAFNSVWTFNSLIQTSAWTNGYTILSIVDKHTLTVQATPAQVTAIGANQTSGAPGIFDFGWIQSASITDINGTNFPLYISPIDAVHRIAPQYGPTGEKQEVSMERDYNNGVLKFRMAFPMGTYNYAVNVVYQRRAPVFVDADSIFQWPDNLNYVLVEMCLFQAMRFAYGSAGNETTLQMNIAAQAVQIAMESEDQEANTQAITPDISIMR